MSPAPAEAGGPHRLPQLRQPGEAGRYWQLEQCIRGMSAACETLGIPVISGNVSLYNESRGQGIYPTPTVGMAWGNGRCYQALRYVLQG